MAISISEPFIKRPIGTSLLAVAVMLLGIIAYCILPVSALPRIDYPTFSITAILPGGDPETMAASVAAPLERRLGQIAGVTEMTSVSGIGTASISIQFSLDRNADLAARDIQAAILASSADLPQNLPNPPTWRRSNPADAPILIMTMTSDTLPIEKVYQVASDILVQRISQIDGIGQILVAGAQLPAVRVQVNPTALANMGVGMEDVRTTLLAADAHGPKGNFDGPNTAYMIETNDQVYEAKGYRPLVIKAKNGQIVRVSDVAKVVDGPVETHAAAYFNRERAVLLIVFKQSTANVIETADKVKALLPQLQKWMPPSVDVEIASDRTATIRSSVADVEFTLLLTVALVVGIVFVFLGKLWSTFAAALTVPLSLAGTCAGMYLCGYNLDNLSLMALTVAVGFVVDDAIVMIENVTRRHELGDNPMKAASIGARQIGFTVLSISISLIAVFIPLFFMSGIVGRLFREFSVTLSMAIAISAVVSLTVTPMICAYCASDVTAQGGKEPKKSWMERISDYCFHHIIKLYAFLLDIVLRHRVITLIVTLATFVATICLFLIIPTGFFPVQDTGRLQVTSEAPTDTSFNTMVKRQIAIAEALIKNPDVQAVVSAVGASNYNPNVNQGRFFIELKPLGIRKHTMDQVLAQMNKDTADIRGVTFYPRPQQDINIGARNTKGMYQYALSDINVAELNEFAPKLVDKLQKLPQLQKVTTDQVLGGLEARLVIDRDAASRYNISPTDIDAALYNAFGERQIAIMYTDLDQLRVVLEVDPDFLLDPSSLEKIYVESPTGLQVPLRNLAKITSSTLPLAVTHQGQFPAVTISYSTAPGVPLGEATALIENAARELNMPPGLRASNQGSAQAFQDSLGSMPWLIATAILAIYIILGVLYESLIHPITILLSLPSAGIGALLALMLFKFPLDIMGFIGLILLIGIVKKNAIMMIDFALEAERDRGMTAAAAVREACLLRFRPIIMTTMAALLGALPLAVGFGNGSEMRRPLGVAIIGGLLVSQALTLFTTPVVYIFLDGLRSKKHDAEIRSRSGRHSAVLNAGE